MKQRKMEQKKKGYSPLIIVVILGVIALYFIVAGMQFFPGGEIVGFSTLGLSKIDFVSNDPDVGGTAWVMLVSVDGSGSSAIGKFDSSQITEEGKNAQKDFTISTSVEKNYVEYSIQNDMEDLNSYVLTDIGEVGIFDTGFDILKEKCFSSGGFFAVNPQQSSRVYCIYKSKEGIKGTVKEGLNIFNAKISFQREGDFLPVISTINNVGDISDRIGTIGFARWQGGLSTGQQLPSPQGQDICALYQGNINQWKTIDCSDFETWKIKSSFIAGRTYSSDADIKNYIQEANNARSLVTQGKQFTASGGQSGIKIGR